MISVESKKWHLWILWNMEGRGELGSYAFQGVRVVS